MQVRLPAFVGLEHGQERQALAVESAAQELPQ
jgi:hypothetical protein